LSPKSGAVKIEGTSTASKQHHKTVDSSTVHQQSGNFHNTSFSFSRGQAGAHEKHGKQLLATVVEKPNTTPRL